MPIRMKVCNVKDYNEALKKRGRVFYLFEQATRVWLDKDVLKRDKCKNLYSNQLFEILAIFRYLFKTPYRQLEGALEEYRALHKLSLPVPDFTTLCRRMAKMSLRIRDHRSRSSRKVKVAIDSSGINIYHTGGGHSKENSYYRQSNGRDQVRKMHIALDPENKDVLDMKMTDGFTHDATVVPQLLDGIPHAIEAVYADGAYDRKVVRRACFKRGAKQVIPPWKRGVVRLCVEDDPAGLWDERNAAIKFIRRYKNHERGSRAWKEKEKYGTRSIVETFFSRFKRVFGFHFMSKDEKARANELMIKVRILNQFNKLGRAEFKKAD